MTPLRGIEAARYSIDRATRCSIDKIEAEKNKLNKELAKLHQTLPLKGSPVERKRSRSLVRIAQEELYRQLTAIEALKSKKLQEQNQGMHRQQIKSSYEIVRHLIDQHTSLANAIEELLPGKCIKISRNEVNKEEKSIYLQHSMLVVKEANGNRRFLAAEHAHEPKDPSLSFPSENLVRSIFADAKYIGAGGLNKISRLYDENGDTAAVLRSPKDPSLEAGILQRQLIAETQIKLHKISKTLVSLSMGSRVSGLDAYAQKVVKPIKGLLFPYIPSGTLCHKLREDKEFFTLPRLKTIVRSLLDFLLAAHKHGLAHLDLKPDNCFVELLENDALHLFVSDFDTVFCEAEAGSTGYIREGEDHLGIDPNAGTPGYKAPETDGIIASFSTHYHSMVNAVIAQNILNKIQKSKNQAKIVSYYNKKIDIFAAGVTLLQVMTVRSAKDENAFPSFIYLQKPGTDRDWNKFYGLNRDQTDWDTFKNEYLPVIQQNGFSEEHLLCVWSCLNPNPERRPDAEKLHAVFSFK